MRQSNDTTAPDSTGAPVTIVVHAAASNRSAIGASVNPANRGDSGSCAADKVFTHSTPLATKVSCRLLSRFMHTSNVGGSSVTLHTAEAVNPASPASPVVVMTLTAAPSRAIASR